MKTKLIALVLFACMMLGLARGVAAAPLDTRIPSDAIIYVGWQGADALAPAYAQSNLKGFLESGKIAEYLSENFPQWTAMVSHGDPDAAKQIDEMLKAAHLMWRHSMALYVGPLDFIDARTPPKFRVAWICDAGADAPALEQFYKNFTDKNPTPPDLNLKVTRDGTVVTVTIGEAGPEMFAAGDKAARLAGAAGFVSAMKGLRPNPAISIYVDVEKILATVNDGLNKTQAPPPVRQKVTATITALGLTSLTHAAYAGGFDKKEWADEAFLGMKAPRTGILSMLDTVPISDEALKMIPKTAVGFSAGKLDLSKLLAEARKIASQINPGQAAGIDEALGEGSKQLGFDIEKDLLNSFGDEWVLYHGARTEDMASHPIVFVHKLRNPASLEKVLAVAADKIKAVTAGKFSVEKLDTGTLMVSGIRLPFLTIAWTVRGNYFYISNLEGISPAIEHVEKKGPSILENQTYLAVRSAFPAQKATSITFSEPAKLYPDVYQLIMTYLPMAKLAGLNIPGNLIPVPQRAAPFLTPGGSVSWADADGFHISSRSAFPGAELLSGQASGSMVAAPALVAAVMLPSLSKSRELAMRSADAANLRGIVNSAIISAMQANDVLPDHVGNLVLLGMSPKLLVSKRAGTAPLVLTDELTKLGEKDFPAFAKQIDAHCDIVYLGKDRKNDSDASMVLVYEKPNPKAIDGINVAFDDCHVEFIRYGALKDVFAATNKYNKEHKLPEIDVDAMLKTARGEK